MAPAAAPHLDHPLLAAIVEAGGGAAAVRAKLGWTDAAFFAERGVPALNFGPGRSELAHTAGEYVCRDSLEAVYGALASRSSAPGVRGCAGRRRPGRRFAGPSPDSAVARSRGSRRSAPPRRRRGGTASRLPRRPGRPATTMSPSPARCCIRTTSRSPSKMPSPVIESPRTRSANASWWPTNSVGSGRVSSIFSCARTPRAGRHVTHKGHIAHGVAINGVARDQVVVHLEGSGLGGVTSQETLLLEDDQVALDRRRRDEPHGLADLAHRRRVAAVAGVLGHEVDDRLPALGEFGHGSRLGLLGRVGRGFAAHAALPCGVGFGDSRT